MVFEGGTGVKGPLTQDEFLSFADSYRFNPVGYVMIQKGYIIGMSISSKRHSGDVAVGVSIKSNCEITLDRGLPLTYINFDTTCEVDAGNVINFVCTKENSTTEYTVVSLLIALQHY